MFAIVIAAAAAAASPLPRGEWHALRHVNVAASRNVSFVISVKQQNLQTLFDSALAVSTPGNPRYGKHLTPDEIHQLTSPHPDDMAAVINWLADHKISPRREHENLHVTATVAAVSSLLKTDFHLYQRSSDGHVILRTTGEYSLPPRVAAIAAIFGLHGTPLPIPKPHGPRHFTPPAAPPVPPDAPASFPPFPPLPPDPVAITPTILAQTYHVKDPYVDRGGKGSQAVAEFQKEYMSKDDLKTFFKAEVPTAQEGDDEVAAFKGVPYKEGTGVEALLDIEFIMGVAPGVHTEFWEWPAQDFCGDLHAYTNALLEPGGPIVNSISYGWQGNISEIGCKPSDLEVVDANWAKLAAAGISVFISSGDSGSQCTSDVCDDSHLHKGLEVKDGTVVKVVNASVAEECCDLMGESQGKAFTFVPHKPNATRPLHDDDTSRYLLRNAPQHMQRRIAAALRGGVAPAASPAPPPVPPFVFDSAIYHTSIIVTPDNKGFPPKAVQILNGTLGPKGGPISIHSANGTWPDATMHFGPAYNVTSPDDYLQNFTVTLKVDGSNAPIKYGGIAMFLLGTFFDFIIYHNKTGTGQFAFDAVLFTGPIPPPPPPPGKCTVYSSVTTTGKSSNPNVTSGGDAISKSSMVFYPSWPASSPWVTAVGATRFVNQTVGSIEMATDQFGSGGGFSALWNESHAAWQSEAVQKYLAKGATLKGFPPSGTFPTNGRATPDVSALGEGYQVYVSGKVESVGGTSASSPAFAGYVSLLNEARFKAGKPQMGFINPFIYANPDAFTDVVLGTNAIGRDGLPFEYGFEAAPGWDAATGLGTPLFDKLLKAALAV